MAKEEPLMPKPEGNSPRALSEQRPWPGLLAFTEADSAFFFGREREVSEMLALVEHVPVVVLTAQTGLGKTSLLQAGLFPRLREADLFPVRIRLRLDEKEDSRPLARQILEEMTLRLRQAGIAAPEPEPGDTLWEYFHRRDVEFWGPRNRLLTPVIVLDQFEEIIRGSKESEGGAARAAAFTAELEALLEHRPPDAVRARLEADHDEALRYELQRNGVKMIISLRKEYLADLDIWALRIPSLLSHRYLLQRMTGTQALEVVLRPGGKLVDEDVARSIVDFVSSSQKDRSVTESLDLREVEPALLCVVCEQLNLRRKGPRITQELLTGEREDIIRQLYERSFESVGIKARHWVEDSLVTPSGYRLRGTRKDALESGVTAADITALAESHILQVEEGRGVAWIELTHDLLTDPAVASRQMRAAEDERRLANERAEAAEKGRAEEERRRHEADRLRAVAERARRRARRWAIAAGAVAVLAVLAMVYAQYMKATTTKVKKAVVVANGFNQSLVAKLQNDLGAKLMQDISQQSALSQTDQLAIMDEFNRFILDYFTAVPPSDSDPVSLRNYGNALDQEGAVLEAQGEKVQKVLGLYRKAEDLRSRYVKAHPDSEDWARDLAASEDHCGNMLSKGKGSLAAANAEFAAALAIRQDWAKRTAGRAGAAAWSMDVAVSEDNIGTVQLANLDYKGALARFQDAFAIRTRLVQSEPGGGAGDLRLQYFLGQSHANLADAYRAAGRYGTASNEPGTAMGEFHASLVIRLSLVNADKSNNGQWLYDLASTYGSIGGLYEMEGDLKDAGDQYNQAQQYRWRLFNLDQGKSDWKMKLSTGFDHLGDIALEEGQLKEAEDDYLRALQYRNQLTDNGTRHDNATFDGKLAASYVNLGQVMEIKGDAAGALANYQKALARMENLSPENLNPTLRLQYAACLDHVGDILASEGKLGDALASYRQALDIREKLAGTAGSANGDSTDVRSGLAYSYDNLGDTLRDQGDLAGAQDYHQKAQDILKTLTTKVDPLRKDWLNELALNYDSVGSVKEIKGDLKGAMKAYRSCVAIEAKLTAAEEGNPEWQSELALNLDHAGGVALAQHDLKAARDCFGRARDIWVNKLLNSDEHRAVATWKHHYAATLDHLGDVDAAQNQLAASTNEYNQAYDNEAGLVEQQSGNVQWNLELAECFDHRGDVSEASGDLATALDYHRKCIEIEQKLADLEPGNLVISDRLAQSESDLGDILKGRGDMKGALDAYTLSLARRRTLLQACPDNSEWKEKAAVLAAAVAGLGGK